MATPLPWERQPGEGSRAYQGFLTYISITESRSIYKAALLQARKSAKDRGLLGEPEGQIERHWEKWSSKHSWIPRAAAFDEDLAKRTLSAVEVKYRTETEQIKVELIALENRKLRLRITNQDLLEKRIRKLDAKLDAVENLPSTDVESRRLNDAGDLVSFQKVKGTRPESIARLNDSLLETMLRAEHGHIKVTRSERVESVDKTAGGPTDSSSEPMRIDLEFSAWPNDQPEE